MIALERAAERMGPLAVLALLGAVASSSACSAGIPALAEPDAPPAPLAIAGPHEELVYTVADDEDPDAPGIQLVVRVDVEDEAIDVVELAVHGVLARDAVADDLAGRRAAFFDVSLTGADTRLLARARMAATGATAAHDVAAEALLRAIQ